MRAREHLAFSIASYRYLFEQMCQLGGFDRGEVEVRRFPDGERYQRIVTPIRDRDVVLVGGTASDTDTLELYDLACSLSKYGAESLTLVIPYYGYSTMERAIRSGEVVTAKTRARLLSAIPLPTPAIASCCSTCTSLESRTTSRVRSARSTSPAKSSLAPLRWNSPRANRS